MSIKDALINHTPLKLFMGESREELLQYIAQNRDTTDLIMTSLRWSKVERGHKDIRALYGDIEISQASTGLLRLVAAASRQYESNLEKRINHTLGSGK